MPADVVTPGLVDVHGHFYQYCTPLGEPADDVCIGRGVTTAVDAGSAGATATVWPLLRVLVFGNRLIRLVMRVPSLCCRPGADTAFCILNASLHGLASAGSTGAGTMVSSIASAKFRWNPLVKPGCEENRDLVVGIKVRLSADAADNGKNELEAYKRALEACEKAATHDNHTFSTQFRSTSALAQMPPRSKCGRRPLARTRFMSA